MASRDNFIFSRREKVCRIPQAVLIWTPAWPSVSGAKLIGQAVEMGLDFYLDACAAVPEEHYQLLADLALAHGYDINYLGLLARQGKLEARKWNRRWYATPAALARYEEEVQQEPRGRPRGGASPEVVCLSMVPFCKERGHRGREIPPRGGKPPTNMAEPHG